MAAISGRLTRRSCLAILGAAPAALVGVTSGQQADGLPIAGAGKATADPRLIERLRPIRAAHDLPALGGAIVTGDRLVAAGVVGMRRKGDPDAASRATVQDRFHVGSCTKAMTATLLGGLVEEGKLAWSITLARALPTLADVMHPAYREVTLAQLLGHRSGLPEETATRSMTLVQMHGLRATLREQRAQYLRQALAEPPAHPPGTAFLYSNRNYIAAGAIAEVAANLAWEDLLRRRLFRPLGMASAGFGAPGRRDRADEPWPHLVRDGQAIPVEPGPRADNPALLGPAGTAHASLADWGKFVAAHLRAGRASGEAPALLKPETFATLHAPEPNPGGTYGYGWGHADRPWAGGLALTHAGSNTMNYAVVWMAPLRDFAVLAVTNQGGDVAAKACDEVAAALIGLQTKAG